MDIRGIGARPAAAAKSEQGSAGKAQGRSDASAGLGGLASGFQGSDGLGRVRDLLARLETVEEVRPEAVERARALLGEGALDAPERLRSAAEGLLGEAAGELR